MGGIEIVKDWPEGVGVGRSKKRASGFVAEALHCVSAPYPLFRPTWTKAPRALGSRGGGGLILNSTSKWIPLDFIPESYKSHAGFSVAGGMEGGVAPPPLLPQKLLLTRTIREAARELFTRSTWR